MAEHEHNEAEMRTLLRGYLLGTLREKERRRVEALLAEGGPCAVWLEEERGALEQLDGLPVESAPAGLAERTLRRVRVDEEERAAKLRGRDWRLLWELAATLCIVGIAAVILLPALSRARESARRSSCPNNLKQMGLVFKMFANESPGGVYPALSSEPGRLMCANETPLLPNPVYPEYLTDPHVLLCPSDPDAPHDEALQGPEEILDDRSYFYLGYSITNDDEMEAFAEAYKRALEEGRGFDEDLPAPPGRGSGGGDTFLRLREGVERFVMTDVNNPAAASQIQSCIPVLMDRLGNHVPGGANVLYLDGHVDFIRYPGAWPMTEKTVRILEELDGLRP